MLSAIMLSAIMLTVTTPNVHYAVYYYVECHLC
jgi:hypothetical protein